MFAARSILAALALLASAAASAASPYLIVWGMETRDPSKAMPPASTMGRDFIAVFDVRPGAGFGRLVAMLPVPGAARMAHHTNYEMPPDGTLFASDYMSGRGFVFNLRQPEAPKLSATFGEAGPYTHSHSFARLPNGHVLATYQFKGEPDHEAGALVELDAAGKVVRAGDASDPAVEPFIRPYSLVALPKIDRVVTTSADMLPNDKRSHVVQVWRLSDLKLLKTILLPKPPYFSDIVSTSAAEPRVLQDGKTVLVVTATCGLYSLANLDGAEPTARFVYDFGARSCGVPAVVGRYWVQTATSNRGLISLDVSNPAKPREVGRLALESDQLPHWVSREPEGNRIAITGYGSLATYVLFATVDPRNGALTLDRKRIDFDRKWPDGWKGAAMPHAALFSVADSRR
jgi:hypothetical protein